MSDYTTLGVQQFAQECYDLRNENKRLRAEVERLKEVERAARTVVRLHDENRLAKDSGDSTAIAKLKAKLDSEEE